MKEVDIMGNSKGNIVLLTIIAVATLLVAVVGATFAYFGAIVPGTESSTPIEITSGTLSTEYDSNKIIHFENGDLVNNSVAKSFDITGVVTGSTNLNYEADLIVKQNTYNEGSLVYTITSSNISENGTIIASSTEPVIIPSGESTINLGQGAFAGPITTGATHKYTLNISYTDSSNNGYNDIGKIFDSEIVVAQTKK